MSDSLVRRVVSGQADIDFIGRSRLWLIASLVLIGISLAALGIRQLNFSIEFTGGSSFTVETTDEDLTAAAIRDALAEIGVVDVIAQVVAGPGGDVTGAQVSVPAADESGVDDIRIAETLADVAGVEVADVSFDSVGPRWGAQVTRSSLIGLVVFLALVVLYISLAFEWRMAAAALVTLLHDIVVTVGVYALIGFRVSPSSVIALLTILGYSLYDTVVVFDRVREDTARITSVSTTSYGELANRALNEVLVRSVSTSITSILPVASLLAIGATLLGAETLADLALALLLGMAVGTYSSIFVATPLLVWLKEKEPRLAELKQRAAARA